MLVVLTEMRGPVAQLEERRGCEARPTGRGEAVRPNQLGEVVQTNYDVLLALFDRFLRGSGGRRKVTDLAEQFSLIIVTL